MLVVCVCLYMLVSVSYPSPPRSTGYSKSESPTDGNYGPCG